MLESGDQKKKWSVKAQQWNCAVSLEYRLLNRCTNEKPLIVVFDWKQLYNHLSSSSAILQRLSVNRRELSSVFKPGRVFWGSPSRCFLLTDKMNNWKSRLEPNCLWLQQQRRGFSDETSQTRLRSLFKQISIYQLLFIKCWIASKGVPKSFCTIEEKTKWLNEATVARKTWIRPPTLQSLVVQWLSFWHRLIWTHNSKAQV